MVKANLDQKGQKSAKMPNQKFQGQERSKSAKFDLFGLAQSQLATLHVCSLFSKYSLVC